MATTDIDRTLQRLRTAADRAGTNVMELERDPTYLLADAANLRGTTAVQWQDTRAAVAHLFVWHRSLVNLLDSAEARRGARTTLTPAQNSELTQMLEGPSIDVSTARTALAGRSLLDASTLVERCTPDEMLDRMSGEFARAQATLARLHDAWSVHLPQLSEAREALDRARPRASELGANFAERWDETSRQLDAISESLLADPIAVDASRVRAAIASVEELGRDLDAAGAQRAALAARIAAARPRLDEVGELVDLACGLRREATTKIAGLSPPEPGPVDPTLVRDLERIDNAARERDFPAVSALLARWETAVSELAARAEAVIATCRGALDERNELRGRLEAYRAKAGAVGRSERSQVAELFQRAEEVLYTAPTDLTAASGLVRACQDAVSGPHPPTKVPM